MPQRLPAEIQLSDILEAIAFFVFGTVFGSFANVLIYRIPRRMDFALSRSRCPACAHILSIREMVPVLGYVFLLGRCRHCGVTISVEYPIVELASGFLCFAAAWRFPALSAVFIAFLLLTLLVVSLVDLRTQEIHSGFVVAILLAGVAWVVVSAMLPGMALGAPYWRDALLGACTGGVPLFVFDRVSLWLFGKDGFGFGDMKLMLAVGVFLGWQLIIIAFFVAFILGGLAVCALMISGRTGRGSYIAFGPFLSAGVATSLFIGERIVDFYVN